MKLNHIFPQTIGIAHYPDADHDAMKIAKHMNGTQPFIYNPHHDTLIQDLMQWIDVEVNQYAKAMQYPDRYYCTESWLHDYRLNTYQPWHSHAGNTISAVYIVIAKPETSTPLYFRNPVNDMMNPMNANMDPDYEPPNPKWYNSEQMAYPSNHGTLYIFRSYLEHSIALKDNTDRRITLALNYNKTKRVGLFRQ